VIFRVTEVGDIVSRRTRASDVA